jgi:hypothetical protein
MTLTKTAKDKTSLLRQTKEPRSVAEEFLDSTTSTERRAFLISITAKAVELVKFCNDHKIGPLGVIIGKDGPYEGRVEFMPEQPSELESAIEEKRATRSPERRAILNSAYAMAKGLSEACIANKVGKVDVVGNESGPYEGTVTFERWRPSAGGEA